MNSLGGSHKLPVVRQFIPGKQWFCQSSIARAAADIAAMDSDLCI